MSKSHLDTAGLDANKPTEPVTSFMTFGNTKFQVVEYFRPDGKPLEDLLLDLVIAQIKQSQTG